MEEGVIHDKRKTLHFRRKAEHQGLKAEHGMQKAEGGRRKTAGLVLLGLDGLDRLVGLLASVAGGASAHAGELDGLATSDWGASSHGLDGL